MVANINCEWDAELGVRKMKCIVKRHGVCEKYDERKVYASCYAACLSASVEHVHAEKICEKVSKEITSWVKIKKEISSDQMFKQIGKMIKKHHKPAAFMYETHRDIS